MHRVAGALYDHGGRTVIGCDYAYLDQADLTADESSTFEIVLYRP